MKYVTLALTSCLAAFQANAADNILAEYVYARATPPAAATSAVFAELTNSGEQQRVLVSASTPAAGKVELHDVIHDGDMMKMRQVEQMIIPPHGTLILKPGGLHIMLFDLKHPLQEGESIDVELTFANGEKQTLSAPVKKVMTGMTHQ